MVLAYNKSFKMIDDIGQKIGDNLLAEKVAKEVAKDVSGE